MKKIVHNEKTYFINEDRVECIELIKNEDKNKKEQYTIRIYLTTKQIDIGGMDYEKMYSVTKTLGITNI